MHLISQDTLRQIDFKEFGELLVKLENKIRIFLADNKLKKFDLVVPILRSGGFTGLYLASKFKILNILPAQYKYKYSPVETIIKKFEFPKLNYVLPDNPNILIADSNTVYGKIAQKVISDIQNMYPSANIYFASATIDQSLRELPGVKEIFYGRITNEKRSLNSKTAKKQGITDEIVIFPWENIEEQWLEIKGQGENNDQF